MHRALQQHGMNGHYAGRLPVLAIVHLSPARQHRRTQQGPPGGMHRLVGKKPAGVQPGRWSGQLRSGKLHWLRRQTGQAGPEQHEVAKNAEPAA